MFELHSGWDYLWLFLAVTVIGLGWAFGNWLWAKLTAPRPRA